MVACSIIQNIHGLLDVIKWSFHSSVHSLILHCNYYIIFHLVDCRAKVLGVLHAPKILMFREASLCSEMNIIKNAGSEPTRTVVSMVNNSTKDEDDYDYIDFVQI